MQTYLNLGKIDSAFNKSLNKLSTGLELPSPEFGGGLFGTANDMEALYGEYTTGVKNINDANGFLETSQATMQEVNDKLLSMQDLAMRASNGIINTAERQSMDSEYQELLSQAQNVLSGVKFNNLSVFNAGGGNMTYSIAVGGSAFFSVNSLSVNVAGWVNATNVSTLATAQTAFTTMKSAVNSISDLMAQLGGEISLIQSKATIVSQQSVAQKGQEAQVNELDFAKEMKNFTSLQVVLQASNAMVAQANTKAQMVLQLFK